MADIVVSEFLDDAALARLAAYEVHYDPDPVDHPEDLIEACRGARGLIVRNRTKVTRALLEAAPKLEVVGRLGVGLDQIDLPACAEHDVTVCPASGANALAVAEYVIGSIFHLSRLSLSNTPAVLAGAWPRTKTREWEVAGRTLGIIGFGHIGRMTAGLARGLGMRIIACDPFLDDHDPAWTEGERRDLPALLAEADTVSLHVPLTDSTRGMIGAAEIDQMKTTAFLINTARGGVVDNEAVATRLRDGKLGGAALDVFEGEPLSAEQAFPLRDAPNLILTPHIAGLTDEALDRVSTMTVSNVLRVLESN